MESMQHYPYMINDSNKTLKLFLVLVWLYVLSEKMAGSMIQGNLRSCVDVCDIII